MARYQFVVYSNPAAGLDAEYNAWYSGTHMQQILALPGVVSARRFKLAALQLREDAPAHQYLAIYEIETEDLATFIDELMKRAIDGRIQRSAALAPDALPMFWQAIE